MSDIMNFECCKAFYDGRAKRNDYRNMKDKARVTFHGDHYQLEYFRICTIKVYPEDLLQINIGWFGQTAVMKVRKLTGIVIFSDKGAYGLHKTTNRVWDKSAPDGRSYPYVDGAWYKNGKVLHPELHVDHKRSIDPVKRLEIQRRLRPLSKLARVLAVLDGYEAKNSKHWVRDCIEYGQAIAVFEKDGATNQLAEIVCGPSVAYEKAQYNYGRSAQKASRIRAAKYGIAKFTEALYKHHDAYVWNEVKP